MSDCLFCRIVAGDVPADKVFEDDEILAFKDIYPKAEVHLLVIPKIHINSLAELTPQQDALLARMMRALAGIAQDNGLKNGFRTIINTGPGGGQEIGHLHIHILGGKGLPGFN